MGAKREKKRGDAGVEARAQEILSGMERLANRVQAAERYIAHAAHELKTPLANLRGELQLAFVARSGVAGAILRRGAPLAVCRSTSINPLNVAPSCMTTAHVVSMPETSAVGMSSILSAAATFPASVP